MKIKAVVLAAGAGTRLHPLTKAIPKCLLPVYDQVMIQHPLSWLAEAGVEDTAIIMPMHCHELFTKTLGNKHGSMHLHYRTQQRPLGVPNALLSAAGFLRDADVTIVVCGDNIFTHDLRPALSRFDHGVHVFLKKVTREQAKLFGVVEFQGKEIVDLVEKPAKPPSNFAMLGLSIWDRHAWEGVTAAEQERIDRHGHAVTAQEANIVTAFQWAREHGHKFNYDIVTSPWFDAGTFENLYRAQTWARKQSFQKRD